MKRDNDVTFRMDFSLRDDATANSKLDQGTAFGTGGQKVRRHFATYSELLNVEKIIPILSLILFPPYFLYKIFEGFSCVIPVKI